MKSSEKTGEVAKALVKAQASMGAAIKGAANPFFKSTYADLSSVIEACKSALNENGIVILQPHSHIVQEGNIFHFVETILQHESGEFISSSTPVVCSKPNDPQNFGSSLSYARRYGLQSLICLPAEDDDGEKAMDRSKKAAPSKNFKKPTVDKKASETKGESNGKKGTGFRRNKKPAEDDL